MNSITKRFLLISLIVISLSGCIIQNAGPEDCEVVKLKIVKVSEGSNSDIVFTDTKGDNFYINRGLEHGLDLATLKNEVVDKKVNLHLYRFWFSTSPHISQLEVSDKILFTEFN